MILPSFSGRKWIFSLNVNKGILYVMQSVYLKEKPFSLRKNIIPQIAQKDCPFHDFSKESQYLWEYQRIPVYDDLVFLVCISGYSLTKRGIRKGYFKLNY